MQAAVVWIGGLAYCHPGPDRAGTRILSPLHTQL